MEMEKDLLLNMYRKMQEIRIFETRITELFAEGKIPGFVHSYLGEEAVAVGTCSNLKTTDYITSTHRGHGHLIAKGGQLNEMMAELYGKATGYCKGKGGSMHIADVDLGILGANGIVGGGFTIAAGAGLASKLQKKDDVTVCFFGDGASNQTTFHEGINLASVWDLPVVFVCENNMYGISLSQEKHQKIKDVSDRAVAYGIPGVTVDGNDVVAVYEAIKEAVKRARNGEGPSLIECKTYRHRGHFEGDPTNYRPDEEVQQWKAKEPVGRFRKKLLEMEICEESELNTIDEEVTDQVEEAIKFAEESPDPVVEEAVQDVYTDMVEEVWS
ncbi:pyruvate dehydrogenase E1 component alpha subunit [Tindallia magadiensis]|uniref:Pyruvate dehydrogenase E1 component alpha subunit n=1 Tax=Tindallia magadiensis TaxID=69895 RepID=A0A1I3BAH1_9FIRM|nr:thiamine pyrophosphate-dependent dehydrogenase E1 component subunit alpha [Tindallia magadiensis]SFH59170.1 pyruvate dehydrogenase E1 component alpha subunit [Tindallia magadiensis]